MSTIVYSAKIPEKPDAPFAWVSVVVLAATHCSAFSDRLLIALVAPTLKTALALSDLEIGLLQGTAFVAIYAFAMIGLAPLADRYNRFGLIIGTLLLWSAATVAFGLATTFVAMVLARMLLGFAQAALSPAALSLITDLVPPTHLGRGISIYTTGSTLGRSLALLGGAGLLAVLPAKIEMGALGALDPWRLIFIIAVVPNLVLIALLANLREPSRGDNQGPSERIVNVPTVWEWFQRHPIFYITHTILGSMAVVAVQTTTAWTTSFLVRRLHMTVTESGTIFGIAILLFAPLGHLSGGILLDRLRPAWSSRAPGLIIAGSLLAAVPLTILFSLASTLPVSFAALGGLIFVLSVAGPAGFSGIQITTPNALQGRATALFLCLVTLCGFGLGPPALGALTDHVFGQSGIGSGLITIVGLAAAIGLAAILVQTVSRAYRFGTETLMTGTDA